MLDQEAMAPLWDQARANVSDYIGCFYNPMRPHWTIGDLSPTIFETLAQAG